MLLQFKVLPRDPQRVALGRVHRCVEHCGDSSDLLKQSSLPLRNSSVFDASDRTDAFRLITPVLVTFFI